MKKINMKYIFFVLILFCSCFERKIDQINYVNNIKNNDSLINSIIGVWGDQEGNKGWEITKDSIFYFNENKSYYYFIKDGNLIGLYKDGPFMLGQIHVINDTLFCKLEGISVGETKAFKVNK